MYTGEAFKDGELVDAETSLAIDSLRTVIGDPDKQGSVVKNETPTEEDEYVNGDNYNDEENDNDGETVDDHDENDYAAGEDDDDDYDESDYDEEDDYDDEVDYDDDNSDDYAPPRDLHERVEFNEKNIVLRKIPLPDYILERYDFLSDLPEGAAVMGGMARSIAREMITGDREPIRDIDLVNILDENGRSRLDPETIDALSRQYMPDDYSFGHGMQNETLEDYFKTRDFTINQCLVYGKDLIVSDFAYNDFEENIIRPTYYEHRFSGYTLSSRMFLKALMMKCVLAQVTSSVLTLEDVNPPRYINDFNIALFLNKAMSRGARTARAYTRELAEWDFIPDRYVDKPIALAKELVRNVYDFEFRFSTDERFADALGCDDLSGYIIPPAMMHYYSTNQAIRRELEDYDDLTPEIDKNNERVFGYYTEAEYDKINRLGR